MRSNAGFVFFFVLAGTAFSVVAEAQVVRQCLGEDGRTYRTTQSSCPQSMPEIRKKIQSCTLADGSKAFGDKCPQGAAQKEAIDSQELSSRDHGLKNQYQFSEQMMIRQNEYERNRLRMQQQADLNVDERNRQLKIIKEHQTERAYKADN